MVGISQTKPANMRPAEFFKNFRNTAIEKSNTRRTETIETKLLKNGMLKLKIMPFALEFVLFPYAQT
jgi:hypothetical protein